MRFKDNFCGWLKYFSRVSGSHTINYANDDHSYNTPGGAWLWHPLYYHTWWRLALASSLLSHLVAPGSGVGCLLLFCFVYSLFVMRNLNITLINVGYWINNWAGNFFIFKINTNIISIHIDIEYRNTYFVPICIL